MPDANGTVLAARQKNRQLRVEEDARHVLRVALQRLDARLRLVVPDAHRLRGRAGHSTNLVVGAGDEIGLVAGGGVVDAIHAHLVLVEGEVGRGRVQAPHLDRVVQRAGGERVAVLRVEAHLHHVVRVALVGLEG